MSESTGLLLRLTEILVGISLAIQCLENLRLNAALSDAGVHARAVLAPDWRRLPPVLCAGLDWLYQPTPWRVMQALRLLAIVPLLLGCSLTSVVAVLWLSQLVIAIRWRGAFNGGSDFMTLTALTGLGLGLLLQTLGLSRGVEFGLYYIALHSASSYFISGGVKCFHKEWRNGSALALFLDEGVYGPLGDDHPFRNPTVATLVCAAFIGFELSVLVGLVFTPYMLVFCLLGVGFHFGVFWYLGLNRFVWAWIATYPSLILLSLTLSSLVHQSP